MVFCCMDSTSPEQHVNDVTAYPGNRRLVKTAGNALMDEQPASQNLRVNVTVPSDVAPGQSIRVDAPDGSRSVNAVVPAGMTTGQTFVVEFPPLQEQPSTPDNMPGFAHALDQTAMPATIPPPPAKESRQDQGGFADTINSLLGSNPNYNYQPAAPVESTVAPPPPTPPTPPTVTPEKVLLVKVPSGVTAGQTLFVEVPGENRTLAATVPPGVSRFHVSYIPRPNNIQTEAAPPTPPPPVPVPTCVTPSQKLLLVQVPPGTSAGSTLHVSIPDEPGRILAAKVPPNVKQFQVAYVPQKKKEMQDSATPPPLPAMNPSYQQPTTMRGGTLPVASPYNRAPPTTDEESFNNQNQSSRVASLHYASPYHHHTPTGNRSHTNYTTNSVHRQESSTANSTVNDYVLPAVGAAAIGTAAVATYGHFHHKNAISVADRGNFFKTEV